MKILKLILLYNMVFVLSFEIKPSDPFGFIEGLSNFSVQLGETSLASNTPPAPASATPAAGGGGDCRSSHQAAGQSCDPAHVQQITATLASVQAEIGSQGAAATASGNHASLTAQKAQLEAIIADCQGKIDSCKNICTNEYIEALNPPTNATAANQAYNYRTECERRFQETANAAQQTNMDMGKALETLMALMQALGMNTDTPTTEAPLCTREPNNAACKTDTASTTTNGDFTTGSYRSDSAGNTTAGDELGTESDPTMGSTGSSSSGGSGGAMGSAGMPLGGGGGGVPSGSKSSSSDKKGEFDGTPKINMASGFANAGGGGGSAGGGRGGSGSRGSASNPAASRTSLDGDQQASKIAQAAEERLRNPANANEPMGGITSVYYLDNFTKVEKRMGNERNTLHEH